MGRAVPKLIKRRAHQLLSLMKDKFSDNFEHNKKVLDEVLSKMPTEISNHDKNLMAGYITRLLDKH